MAVTFDDLREAMTLLDDQTPAYITHPRGRLQESAYAPQVYVLAPQTFIGESEPLVIVPTSLMKESRAKGIPAHIVASWFVYKAEAERIEARQALPTLPLSPLPRLYPLDLSGS